MGSAHARNIAEGKIEGAVLAAVCDINPKRCEWAENELGCKSTFKDHEALLKSGLCDAVIIATPHYFHAPIAIRAFECGCHVMTEKPESVSVSDAYKMNEAADKSGLVYGIMFNQRTSPLFRRAREIVRSGRLGKMARLTWIVTNWYRTQRYYDTGAWRATFDGEGGGVLLNQAPHNLDLLQWIFGMPSSVYAICDTAHYHNIEVEDNATIMMKYDSGARAQFITTTGEYAGTNRLEIVGSKGKIVIEDGVLKSYLTELDEREYCFESEYSSCTEKPVYEVYKPTEKESAHIGVLTAFCDKISGRGELIADGREGVNQLTLTNAAYLSSWTGKEIKLPLDTELFDSILSEKRRNSSYKSDGDASPDGKMSDRWEIKW